MRRRQSCFSDFRFQENYPSGLQAVLRSEKNLQKALEKLRDEANVKILVNFDTTSQADKEGKKPQEAKPSEVQEITVTESSPSPAQPAK